ncbi:hypothetical protein LWI28_022277 [Acer negundo]|uniref:Uncharacterized protein n=1 Tax=Acer negundo TaxID=4023 RepID=A0AAD5J133_ACENE|nr:hypothetical protein LWI28_022277 [Acer negundo]KAK4846650.1 hypothetical protein QYF36_020295 [Acer negundo]
MVIKYSALPFPRPIWRRKRSLTDDLRLQQSPGNTAKNVVIVMDGFKDVDMETLEWALQNITTPCSTVTLLGIMPWLNIPLYSKTWRAVWMLEFEDLINSKEKPELKSDAKYLKLQAVVDLCKKYGVRTSPIKPLGTFDVSDSTNMHVTQVVPQKEVVMGFPLRLLVLERIISLHATWVIFDSDKYHKKNREFYEKRIPCNAVMINEEGYVEMIKGWPLMTDKGESAPGESPASLVPTPQLKISERLKEILEENEQEEDNEQTS